MGIINAKEKISEASQGGLRYQLELLTASFEMRVLNILVALICANVIRKVIGVDFSSQIITVFYLWLITAAVYLAIFKSGICRTRRLTDNLQFSYYFLGVAYATLLVHFLGGAEWVAFFIYLFDIIDANVLMKRTRAATVIILVFICYLSTIYLEYRGILHHHQVFAIEQMKHNIPEYVLTTNIIVVGAIFLLISLATGVFSKMRDDREHELVESRARYEAKSEQLEKITQELRKQAAENKYIKRATMGYIEKKEFEIATGKKDLEDQIDKLRRTQKSMFFMIEDLNEMSGQLKEGKDHLEDKVRERTDELLDISQKLHRSERLAFLGKLAGSVTHELRNPLAVLKNAAYFLEKTIPENKKNEKITKYIEVIKREITMIDAIIDDIMGFAKTRAPDLEEADMSSLLDNTISFLNVPDLVKIKKDYEKTPRIKVDSNQLMHAIVNIANNAIMAMSGNGTLTFRLRNKGAYVCLEINDTGPGIPPDQRDLIFEPLYSSKPKGTGLGLPIAKMMIENHEGRIEFESELGEGTTFYMYLPVSRKGRGE